MQKLSHSHEVALLRIVAQGLVGSGPGAPEEVVHRLLALQAQDYWSGLAAVAARSTGRPSDVEGALDAGRVVRSWPVRGTLHLVAAGDLRWLRDLLAPREIAAAAAREAKLGLGPSELRTAERIAGEVLTSEGPTTRARLAEEWRNGGLYTAGQRSYHLIWHLAQTGTLCFGPVRAGQQLLVLTEDWIPGSPSVQREEALAALARRYFGSHGPATTEDLSRWANLTASDTKLAVAAARHDLSVLELGGVEYLLGPTVQDELADYRRAARGVFALPGFDELIFGYRDRSPTLPDDRASRVLRDNGTALCTIVLDGRVVATWKRPERNSGGKAEITELAPIPERLRAVAARQISALLGHPAR